MTAADYLARVEALDKAAESGPWFLDTDGISIYYVFHNGDTLDRDRLAESSGDDARLIAAYRAAAPVMAAALRAVLDLHKPQRFRREGSPDTGIPEFVCTHCHAEHWGAVAHPCRTVTAIESALTEGEPRA